MQVSGLGCVGEMVFECCDDVARMLLECSARRGQRAGG